MENDYKTYYNIHTSNFYDVLNDLGETHPYSTQTHMGLSSFCPNIRLTNDDFKSNQKEYSLGHSSLISVFNYTYNNHLNYLHYMNIYSYRQYKAKDFYDRKCKLSFGFPVYKQLQWNFLHKEISKSTNAKISSFLEYINICDFQSVYHDSNGVLDYIDCSSYLDKCADCYTKHPFRSISFRWLFPIHFQLQSLFELPKKGTKVIHLNI